MKPASNDLINLLATRQFEVADLYTFTLVDGTTVLRYTSADINITYASNTYSAGGKTGVIIGKQSGGFRWKRGLEVDTVRVSVIPREGTVNSIAFLTAIQQGFFDGATVRIERAYMSTWGTVVGTILLFLGRVSDIECFSTSAEFTISSHLELLNQPFPRNLYQGGCVNTLYDASCALNKASFATTGTCRTGSTKATVNINTLSPATGYFDLGIIAFTGGANAGLSRTVKTYTKSGSSTVTLIQPLPTAPSNTDAFTIYPGCDKAQTTCSSKFSNLANFRGFPYIPENQTAV